MNKQVLLLGCVGIGPSSAFAQLPIDTTPPVVALTTVRPNDVVPTGVVLRADASDDELVTRVRFLIDGEPVGDDLLLPPYWFYWDTRNVAEGPHTITVTANDDSGHAASVSVPVVVDRTPPALTLTTPAAGATVAGTPTIAAAAADEAGIESVAFSINGVPMGERIAPPYEMQWDTTLVPDGNYAVRAAARDRAGGLNSTEVAVSVSNGTTRIENGDASITYAGGWMHGNTARPWSGGTASIATLTGFLAAATVSFEGTGVSWIGFLGPQAGIARVYLDGQLVATVDLYDPVERLRTPVYRMNGLVSGVHTLVIEATGARNPLSSDPFVVVDSFILFNR